MRAFFILFLLIPSVFAHGFGDTQTVMSNNHAIEMGLTDAPKSGERVGLSFSIDEDGTPIAAEQATVRISKGDDIFFISDSFHLSNETLLTMSFIFPEPGMYDVDIVAGEDRATFSVRVETHFSWWGIGIAAVAGVIIAFLVYHKSRT